LRLRAALGLNLSQRTVCYDQRYRSHGRPQTRLCHSKTCCHVQIVLISQCLPLLPAR